MGESHKTKAIQTNLGTCSHNLTYTRIIQAYLEPCITLRYLTLWYIQNPGIFTTPPYSEGWHIQYLRHIQNPVTHLR